MSKLTEAIAHFRTLDESDRPMCTCPNTDKKGVALALGDYVSQPTYPRGSMRGWVTRSKRAFCARCKGAAYAVVDAEGTTYNLSGKASKLKSQKPMPTNLKEALTDPELKHFSRRKWKKMQAKHKISGAAGAGEAQRRRENIKKTSKCTQRGGKMVFGRCWFPKGK